MTDDQKRCLLCGDAFHDSPDTEGWMGLICPGASATEKQAEVFLCSLAKAYAEHIAAEFEVLNEMIAERRRIWYERTRTDVTHEVLQADCNVRTGVEQGRQRTAEVFQEFGGFEMDLPHLTVKGRVAQRPLVQSSGRDKGEPEDAQLYIDPGQDVP